MIGRRSSLKWFARLALGALLYTGSAGNAEEARLFWSMIVHDPAAPVATTEGTTASATAELALPTDIDWFIVPEIEIAESHAERWPSDAEPELVTAAPPAIFGWDLEQAIAPPIVGQAAESVGNLPEVGALATPVATLDGVTDDAESTHQVPVQPVDAAAEAEETALAENTQTIPEPEIITANSATNAQPLPTPEDLPIVVAEPLAFDGWELNEEITLPETDQVAEPAGNPWDEMEFFGPVAALGDISDTTQAEIEDLATPDRVDADEEPMPAEAAPEAAPEADPLLNEEFLVATEVLEDAANTEYLEDLGLLAAAGRQDYNELTEEIASQGVDALDAPELEEAHTPRFSYSHQSEQDAPALTLPEILELALANNPEVGAALAREEQARWQYREGQVYKYPTIDVIAEGGPEYNRPATESSHNEDITPGRTITFRINQLLYDGGVSLNESDRRLQVRRTTELETRLIVEDIVVKAAEFYSQVLQHQRSAKVAEEFVEEMQSIVKKLEVMFESGAASKLELDFAKARLASARAETGNTKAQLNDALSNLEFLTGPLPEFTAVPPKDIHGLSVLNLHEYIDIARKQNATVLLNRSTQRALRYKIRAQRAQFSPILSLNLKSEALADEGGNLAGRNTTEVKLKAEYFLFDGGARRARLNRTRAQLKELEYEDERLYNEVDREVKQAYNQITTNRMTLDATEDEIASNRELRRLNRQNLEMGDISIIELIEVEERLFNSQATWYRVSSEMFKNYYELQVSAGELASLVSSDLTQTRIEDEPVAAPLTD